jgi:hypothetical protein
MVLAAAVADLFLLLVLVAKELLFCVIQVLSRLLQPQEAQLLLQVVGTPSMCSTLTAQSHGDGAINGLLC